MASNTATGFTVVAGILALLAAYVYFFGIPPEMKRQMEKKALETMGENKASYVMKDQISKLPASDQENVKDIKKTVRNLTGGALKNPLGDKAGDAADDATRPLTGR